MSDQDTDSTREYRVLARKYRPQSFNDLLGQDALVRTLTNALSTGRLAHAWMLTGVRGVGKTTTARIIAKALNCIGPDGTGEPTADPCGVCEPCRAITEDRHVDVMEMDAASRTGVDDIREILDGVRYRPSSARYKVYIIDEVHMLSRNAFNALLKTLEEPPEHVKFVFATTEIRKVPITVLSRCQRFDLRRLDPPTLTLLFTTILEKEGVVVEEAALALLARAADGSARDGLSLLDQAIAHRDPPGEGDVSVAAVQSMLGLADRGEIFDLFEDVMAGRVAPALERVQRQHQSGADPLVVVQDLMELTHLITRFKVAPASAGGPGASDLERERGGDLAEKLSVPHLARAWQMLMKGIGEVQQAPSALAALEMVLIRLTHVTDMPTPGDLARMAAGQSPTAAPQPTATPAPTSETTSEAAPEPTPKATGEPAAEPSAIAQAIEPMPVAVAAAEPEPAGPGMPTDFASAVALFEHYSEPLLRAHLVGSARLIAFEPGRIELSLDATAPGNLAQMVSGHLSRWTGRPWVIEVSEGPAAPTIIEQRQAAEDETRRDAAEDPVVAAVLAAFPGAEIEAIRPLVDEADVLDDGEPDSDDDMLDSAIDDEDGNRANEA
jgi:DNA polymerase-3 subunit gamma/tau